MTDKKGFILNHQVDGLCFIEAPEKPNVNHSVFYLDYLKALELAIANRMVIVNIDVLYKNAPLLDNLEEGEWYRWAGTWHEDFINANDYLAGAQKRAVRLIAPSEQKEEIFNIFNAQGSAAGLTESDLAKLRKPVVDEDQEELWKEVAQHLNAQLEKEQVPIEYFEAIREQFTITRNP